MELYHGAEVFEELKRNGTIEIGTTIRVYNYDAGTDPHYVVGGKGLYEFDSDQPLEPSNVLSKENARYGWCITDYSPMHLPDEELKAHFAEE